MNSSEKVVLHEDEVRRALTRIAHEIVERNPAPADADSTLAGADATSSASSASRLVPAVVGIHRRGAFLGRRLHTLLEELLDAEVPLGDLDIGFYRDDVASRPDAPVVHASHIDFDITGRTVVIVDDVLFTGRTVRAAIEALFAYGRPARVQLAVLADRGHRELPIRPDYVGKNLPTSRAEHVHVRLRELDGVDEVAIATGAPAPPAATGAPAPPAPAGVPPTATGGSSSASIAPAAVEAGL
jgi:pyrimidine operon attenuation protein/uracil phosphoribosyltransferase